MNLSVLEPSNTSEDHLLALRSLITQLAGQCGLDLTDKAAVRHFLDSEVSSGRGALPDAPVGPDLRAMLILLFRLEASSSEDLGFEGMRRLWLQHSEILARFSHRESVPV